MIVRIRKKLNRLGQLLPEGLLANASWLEERGYTRSLRSQYVAAGWLDQPARGVYRRGHGSLSWQQVVISLQTIMKKPVSVGGRSALGLQGFAHYLSLSPQTIHLYSDEALPGWVSKLPVGQYFETHNRTRFLPKVEIPREALCLASCESDQSERTLPGALRLTRWGQWDWPLIISTPERAILEMIDELPGNETFHHVDMIMEGLATVSPRRIQSLLEQATSIKVKRLFLFFADRHHHRWFDRLDFAKINLGSGKRMLVKGGKLDPKYQITIPEGLDAVQ